MSRHIQLQDSRYDRGTIGGQVGATDHAVVIPALGLPDQFVLTAPYTGLTRGTKLVILVGQRNAIAIAVKNDAGRRRWSKLDEWMASQERGGQCVGYLTHEHADSVKVKLGVRPIVIAKAMLAEEIGTRHIPIVFD